MKELGKSPNGYIVEMTADEREEFLILCEAVSGKGYREYPLFVLDKSYQLIDFDFSNVFHAIRAWYLCRMMVNQFQGLLNDIKNGLGDV